MTTSSPSPSPSPSPSLSLPLSPSHTYGPSCRLRPISPSSHVPDEDDNNPPPPIQSQFFYSSPIPIDDPLSAASTIITTSSSTPAETKLPLRPFSAGDNLALERSWLGFGEKEGHNKSHKLAVKQGKKGERGEDVEKKFSGVVQRLFKSHKERHEAEGLGAPGLGGGAGGEVPQPAVVGPACCPELRVDASAELRREFCAVTRRRVEGLDEDRVVEGVMGMMLGDVRASGTGGLLGSSSPMVIPGKVSRPGTIAGSPAVLVGSAGIGSVGRSDGISGKPFVRVDLDAPGRGSNRSSGVQTPEDRGIAGRRARADSKGSGAGVKVTPPPPPAVEDAAEVMVGISRLHVVSLPVLQMKPIYWSPVNDVSTVLRATWFYRWVNRVGGEVSEV